MKKKTVHVKSYKRVVKRKSKKHRGKGRRKVRLTKRGRAFFSTIGNLAKKAIASDIGGSVLNKSCDYLNQKRNDIINNA